MLKFNINDNVLVQITEVGMEELHKNYDDHYIEHRILNRKELIDGEEYYRIQLHSIFEYFGDHMFSYSNKSAINFNILIPNKSN